MFDLNYYVLTLSAELTPADVPGLLVVPPAKPGGRGREADLLIIHLSFNGPSPYLAQAETELLKKTAQTYLKASGSVTSGLRLAVEQLNSVLLERNLREAKEGVQAFAALTMAVLRDEVLFVAQAGSTHSLVVKALDVQDFSDPFASTRGLGASSSVNLRFYQSMLQAGDVLLMCARPPQSWNAANLAGSAQLTLEHLRRRLLVQAEADVFALVFKFQPGKGTLHPLRLTRTHAVAVTPRQPPPQASPVAAPRPSAVAVAEGAAAGMQPAPEPIQPPAPAPAPAPAPVQVQEPQKDKTTQAANAAREEAAAARLAARRIEENRRRKEMASAWLRWKARRERISAGWKNFLSKVLPVRANQSVGLSPAGMFFIAVAVPLVVAAVAVTVYFNTGRTEQRQVYFQQAAAYTAQALAQSDPLLQRNDWIQVLNWLDKTEAYGVTEETRALRRRAQQSVDSMDKIVRLDFRPVNSYGFASTVKITRVLASINNELFVLDGNSGRVSRLVLGADGYDLDGNFTCGPGLSGAINIGPLVDIDLMPLGNPHRASIIGLDRNGTVVFCSQGKTPISSSLPAPATGWGEPTRIHFSANRLSVLDAKSNAVWRYTANQDMIFDNVPRSFLKDNQSITMNDVVDMTVYIDDLFLLRADGRMVKCSDNRAGTLTVRCTDPMKFEDRRPGREVNPTILPDAVFTQLITVEMPNPSLYMLESSAPAVYQFSLALYLNEQYRLQPYGETVFPKKVPTAFAVSSNRQAFIAFGDALFYAQIR